MNHSNYSGWIPNQPGPQSALCLNFLSWERFSFCTCRLPHQYHFPQQITVCKILYWKGLLCPQWALANSTFPCFSPPQAHPYRLPTLRIISRTQYYATKMNWRKTIPETTIHFLLWEQCLLLSFQESPRNSGTENIRTYLEGKNVCSGYVSKAQILLLLLSSCVTLSKLLNLSAFDSLILETTGNFLLS